MNREAVADDEVEHDDTLGPLLSVVWKYFGF